MRLNNRYKRGTAPRFLSFCACGRLRVDDLYPQCEICRIPNDNRPTPGQRAREKKHANAGAQVLRLSDGVSRSTTATRTQEMDNKGGSGSATTVNDSLASLCLLETNALDLEGHNDSHQ